MAPRIPLCMSLAISGIILSVSLLAVYGDLDPLHNVASPSLPTSAFTIHNLPGTGITLPGGTISPTTTTAMPGVASQGTSQVVIKLNPGAILIPHWHPRATEVAFVVQGSPVAWFVDSANTYRESALTAGDVIIFPRGLLHGLQNVGDTPLTVTSALNGEDPGAIFINVSLRVLPEELVKSMFLLTHSAKDIQSPKTPIVLAK